MFYFYWPPKPAISTPPPNNPSSLIATVISSTEIDLAWTDNSSNETAFNLERGTDGIVFGTVINLPAGTTSYPDTGLTPGQIYYYRVYALKGSVVSDPANIVHATTFEAETQSYITAGSIIDSTEINATDAFVKGLKTNSLLSKLDVLMLCSPTSEAASLLNFIDLSSATNVNASAWANTGFTTDGLTNYINTNFATSALSNWQADNGSLGVYLRSVTLSGTSHACGANPALTTRPTRIEMTAPATFVIRETTTTAGGSATGTLLNGGIGFISGSRVSNTDIRAFQNGAQSGAIGTTANVAVRPDIDMFVGCSNNNGTPGDFIAEEFCLFFMGSGLTAAEMSTLYTLVQAFQTNVIGGGRQV